MPTHDARFHRHVRPIAVAALCLLAVLACEDDQAPTPQPGGVFVVSGDAQYTRKGTTLEEPVVVRVFLEDSLSAANVAVRFQVIEGGGTLSRTLATTNSSGRTSVRWTVGPETGLNRLRITVDENSSLTTTATATSSEYYCVEEDPTFIQKFVPGGNLMLLSDVSIHTAGFPGLLEFSTNAAAGTFSFEESFSYPEGVFQVALRDCAFSTNGDLFLSWNHIHDEIVKVVADSVSHFASLENFAGAEIAMTPHGVLIGCDPIGPFYVTCRDSLFRFEDAIFSGFDRDAANHDALAAHPVSGDVYFIYKADRRLYRVPFDGTTAGNKAVAVNQALPIDVSDGARGMIVDSEDGSIYILVESAATKSIVRVNSAGDQTTVYDFFDRGAGDAAGIQSDLAIDREPIRYLYTLDTLNNKILRYSIAFDTLVELQSDGDPFAASGSGSGERVGLDVIPGP